MNKYEKALNELFYYIDDREVATEENNNDYMNDLYLPFKELVERTTPKKPTILSESYIQCESCNVIIELDEDKNIPNYCECCGQTLDWVNKNVQ